MPIVDFFIGNVLEMASQLQPCLFGIEAVRVYNSGNISINDSAWTALTFDSERTDTEDEHSTVANTNRLTANQPGVRVISGHIEWAANATGRRRSFSAKRA